MTHQQPRPRRPFGVVISLEAIYEKLMTLERKVELLAERVDVQRRGRARLTGAVLGLLGAAGGSAFGVVVAHLVK